MKRNLNDEKADLEDEKLEKMLHSIHKRPVEPIVFDASKARSLAKKGLLTRIFGFIFTNKDIPNKSANLNSLPVTEDVHKFSFQHFSNYFNKKHSFGNFKNISLTNRLYQNKRALAGISGLLAMAVFFNFLFLSPMSPISDYFKNINESYSSDFDNSKSEISNDSDLRSESQSISTSDSSSITSSQNSSKAQSKSESSSNTGTKGTISNKKATIATINKNKALPKFKTYQEIIDLLKTMKISYGRGYLDDVMMPMESANATPTTKDGMAASDFSSTNTQVSGIDEGDIIKNDGQYLYIVNNNSVSIVKAYPVNEMAKISTITLPKNEFIQEIYVKGNLLTIIGNSYGENTILPNPLAADINNSSATSKIAATWIYNKQMTVVHVYDLTNKASPLLKRDLSFDGYLVSSREKDGKFYLVTNSYITVDTTKDLTAKDVLPSYSDSAKGKMDILIPADSIAFCPENISANYLIISCFDIDDTIPVSVETVLGAGNVIYMSNNALYIVQPFYRYTQVPSPVSYPGTASSNGDVKNVTPTADSGAAGGGTVAGEVTPSNTSTPTAVAPVEPIIVTTEEGTVVMKFSIVESGVKFSIAGEVPGQVLNQYSMDEYLGTFRIATTKWSSNGSSNNLYTINSDMKVIGKIENLAPGERIYAVRFTGKTGYIVTYRQIDPLFVIDLSIANAPKVVGELKIPGFSNYLHPISSTLLLGIGQNTIPVIEKDSNGNEIVVRTIQSGLKISLFDVSNPQKPVEIDSKLFGGPGSNTEAQYNPRAFVWWNSKSTALFPAYLQGADGSTSYDNYSNVKSGALAVEVDATNRKLIEKGRLFPENSDYAYYTQSRVVYIGNSIYLSMNSKLYAFDATTMQEIGRIGY